MASFIGATALRIRSRLATRVDGSSVAVFRFVLGLVIAFEVLTLFQKGWIAEFWINPVFRFSYPGFEWVRALPQPWLQGVVALLGVAALFLALGLVHRVAAWCVFLLFTYQFLLEATRYLNHHYAASLFAFLLCIIPVANTWSVDRSLGLVRGDTTVPLWSVWLLRFQVGVVYVYGGLAKLQGDWLAGQPVESWMSRRTHIPFVNFLIERGWEVPFYSYGGLLFDLLVVPALLWRRTRAVAFVVMLAFHLLNESLFNIGTFPWMMMGLTTVFLAPTWPRKLLRTLLPERLAAPGRPASDSVAEGGRALSRLAFSGIVVYVAVQCLWPARSHLYPGNALWREQAQLFSWRMMLREKTGETGMRVVTDRGVDTLQLSMILRPWQVHPVGTRPFLTLQLAHYLADYYRGNGYNDVHVYADSWISLNGRPPQLMIDPRADLAVEPQSVRPATWIVPLDERDPPLG
jgi:hypothetical protein